VRVVKYTHACVRLESADSVVVIDPGTFSERAALDGVDAVLITHEHHDHIDVEKVADALDGRPGVRVYAHPAVRQRLAEMSQAAGLTGLADVVTGVDAGDEFEAATLRVRAYGGLHAEIHPDLPRVPNLGFLVENSLYHPGDSFTVPGDAEVETLFVPISGPWLKLSDSVDFVRAVAPRRAYALHDCLLSDAGVGVYDGAMGRLARCDYARLAPGEAITTG
jgi:L-ascorbate metabolism protein UlaG (beta-lactamase superfamily)